MSTPSQTKEDSLYLSVEEYLRDRVDDQINWYEAKSGDNKRKYQRGQLVLLVMAAIVTLSGTFANSEVSWVPFVVPICGALIAIVSGVVSLYKYQENWLQYRTTAESLKHQKFLFVTKSEPYSGDEAFVIFVSNVENLISQENSVWTQNQQSNAEQEA